MATLFDDLPPREALADIARQFHQRGWMAGTAGNLSVRADKNESFWITASGKPKGQLTDSDFVRVGIEDGSLLDVLSENNKASAETSIHQTIYQLFPDAHACLHVHSVDAVLATQRFSTHNRLPLPAIEMLKGYDIWDKEPDVAMLVFANDVYVPDIAQKIKEEFSKNPPQVPALMIENHGITVWGRTLQEAYNRVEISEFLMQYLARC